MGSEEPWCFLKPSEGSGTSEYLHALGGDTPKSQPRSKWERVLGGWEQERIGLLFLWYLGGREIISVFIQLWCWLISCYTGFYLLSPTTTIFMSSAESAYRRPPQLDLMTLGLIEGRLGRVIGTLSGIQLFLPTTCMEFWSNYTWPQGSLKSI